MMQAAEKLGLVDYSITITSIQRLYEEAPWHEEIILDEYDSIMQSSPYLAMQQGMRGVWELRGKKMFEFSATSSPSNDRLVNNYIAKPKVLKFKSEFEIANCPTQSQKLQLFDVRSKMPCFLNSSKTLKSTMKTFLLLWCFIKIKERA